MTIVYDVVGDEPCTHALVIGCGRFPFVENSANMARQTCYDSAVEMIRFLVNHRECLILPLGTIDCLLGDPRVDPDIESDKLVLDIPGTEGSVHPVSRPILENVTEALDQLTVRCRPGDTLFLYFCSHGVAGRDETGLLILEDIHRRSNNRWQQMLDVKFLSQVLPSKSRAAAVWIYFDACQEVMSELKDQLNGVNLAHPLIATATEISRCRVVSATLGAARYGAAAHAPRGGGVAYFTNALIEGMSHCCVERRNREWQVTAMRIMFGLEKVARAVDGTVIETIPLIPFNGDAQLLRIDQPSIPVHVSSAPSWLIDNAVQAQVIDASGQVVATKHPGIDWRFRINQIPASYTVRVTYNGQSQDTCLEVDAPAVLLELKQA